MSIHSDRFKKRFYRMAEIGQTINKGIHRLALSDEDKEARDLFIKWMEDLKLEIRIDDLGNIYGIKEGENPEALPVVIGSHLDSVPKGGKYDGTLGVLAGLTVIEAIIDEGICHDKPLIVANFTNEEGARFPKPMIASGVLAGRFSMEDMYQLSDDSGKVLIEELERIGYKGKRKNRLEKVDKFFELHIEQGPVLIDKEVKVGIVEGIQGLSWHEVIYIGEADHAGPSPMHSRKDAGTGAIKAMNRLYEWVKSFNDRTSITFGKVKFKPDVINVIPGEASFSIDIRHPEGKVLEKRIEEMKEILIDVAIEEHLDNQIIDLSNMPPVQFSKRLTGDIEEICKQKNISYHRMYSGAGHDAMYMQNIGETVMIFVPSINGKSHNEYEESHWDDIIVSTNVMYELVKKHI